MSDKLRILCIHGYRQNGDTFRERTGAFRKLVKKQAELFFITAPNVVPPLGGVQSGAGDQRGWWFSRPDDYYHAQDPSDCDKGFQESLQVIVNACQQDGPFDGVLGFSQGAALVSILCGMLQQQGGACAFHFNFAILVAGFKSRSCQHEEYYKEQIHLPTLHVYGETDQVIDKQMSEDLLPYFSEPEVLQHSGGHFIPASGPHKTTYLNFLDKMLTLKNS